MHLIRKGAPADIFATIALAALLAAVAVHAAGPELASARSAAPLVMHARPGSLVRVGDLFLTVPPAGQGVAADTLSVDGRERALVLQSRTDGTVAVYQGAVLDALVRQVRTRSAGAGASTSSPTTPLSPCSDSHYSTYSSKWTKTYEWSFKISSTPSEVHQDNAESALKHAAGNITGADNDCGMGDTIDAHYHYLGTTSTGSNVTSSGGCGSSDGKNVVEFGTLPSTMLALSCWWFSGSSTTSGDLRLNRSSFLWVANIGSACSNKFGIEAVGTHEFGHIFGMAHVSEATDGYLTMSPTIYPCQSSEATLGRGDIVGLETKY
ncbi:MAG TPA: matrixin family metalloprotease [Actinomycetota bacterium]|nr:matrixin family metalloprotease [Actinomycetota bacterium]